MLGAPERRGGPLLDLRERRAEAMSDRDKVRELAGEIAQVTTYWASQSDRVRELMPELDTERFRERETTRWESRLRAFLAEREEGWRREVLGLERMVEMLSVQGSRLREAIQGHCQHTAGCNANRPRSYACPDCGNELVRVKRPLYLNEDQWDATKAGDFYCVACAGERGGTDYRYYDSGELPRGECSCWVGSALTASPLSKLAGEVLRAAVEKRSAAQAFSRTQVGPVDRAAEREAFDRRGRAERRYEEALSAYMAELAKGGEGG